MPSDSPGKPSSLFEPKPNERMYSSCLVIPIVWDTVIVPMSVEADIPALWECRCGTLALRENAETPDAKPGKPPRTHWDMLMERRTTAELEVLLEERLALLRSGALTARRRSA